MLALAFSILAPSPAHALNPIVPGDYFGADPAGRQWADGRMYVYGSHDTSTKDWCSHDYHLFSSADLVTWVDLGELFRSSGSPDDVPWTDARLYAPDALFRDGRYYLYFSLAQDSDDEGVAVGTSPAGPFSDATVIAGVSGIDPAAFIDDDGQGYLYWGQNASSAAKLAPNLLEIDRTTVVKNVVTRAEHHFHEGSSLRKRDGIYYYVFSDISRRSKPTCLGYATSSSPLGPFSYRGVIIDNNAADPAAWNNHGSIVEFNGQWYVLYHRASHGSKYLRKICIEPISFDADGTIPEVLMTTQGVEGPLSPYQRIEAELACELSGSAKTEACCEGGDDLGFIQNGNYAVYRYLDFGTGATALAARVASGAAGGTIEARLDSASGTLIAACQVTGTGEWQAWQTVTCPVDGATGVHALYLRFTGGTGNLLNLNWFQFIAAGDGGWGDVDAEGPRSCEGLAAATWWSGEDGGAGGSGCACRTAGGQAGHPSGLPGLLLAGIGVLAFERRRKRVGARPQGKVRPDLTGTTTSTAGRPRSRQRPSRCCCPWPRRRPARVGSLSHRRGQRPRCKDTRPGQER